MELIQSYGGAEYFDADHRVYKYVMILLACHRFGDAINYLHRHDKPFVAAHVASIALYYGLVLPHLPLQCNPSLPIVVANGMSDLNPSQVLDSYLRKYLRAHLQVVHPNQSTKEEEQALVRIMVDYLILLHSRFWMTSTSLRIVSHDSSLSLKEVYQHNALMHFSHTLQDFIVNLPHPSFVEAIVGRLQENTPGVRSRGALDDYLSTAEVQQLLVKVSMAFKTAFHDYPMALHYCLLSGEYGLLLEELVDLLMTVYSSFYHSLVYPNSSTSSGTAEWMSHDHGNQEGGPHSGCLLPNISQHSRDQFLQWFEYLQEFLQKYLRNDVPSSLLAKINALENGPRYVNALLFLHNLYLATKVYLVDGWIVEASRLFDQLPVLSMGGGDQAMSASLLGILHQSLVSQIGDEVLCLYAQCQYTLFQYYKQRSLAGPSVTGAGSAGEVLRQQEGCAVARDRLRAVYHYVHQNKQLLRSRERTVAEVQRLCAVAL